MVHINRLIFLVPLGSVPRLGLGDIHGMGRGDGGLLALVAFVRSMCGLM